MKTFRKILFLQTLLFISLAAFGQTSQTPKTLVDEGVALFDKGDYKTAMEKYKAALAIDPNDLRADFEMGYTLYTTGKGMEAIAYLEPILKSNDSKYETYELLGSIYDDNNQPEKAIEAYKAGIKNKPDYERLHFNLAVTYERLKRYADAEAEAIEALKLDPTHASAHRIYGLATLNQNKRSCAVLAFCNFLLLEPQSDRSAGVYKYLDTIFKMQEGKNIVLDGKNFSGKELTPLTIAEISVNLAVTTKDTLSKLGKTSPVDQMMIQLKTVFIGTGNASKKAGAKKDFFWTFYADYFYKLEESDNILAFTRYITLSAYKEDDLAWFKDHDKDLKDFQKWLSDTKRDL
jgi:tetratricopeptide (TPR) repeat protein